MEWTANNDNIHSFDYAIPELKTLYFEIVSKKESLWSTFDDKIQRFVIKTNDDIHNKEEIEISKNDEAETILEFSTMTKKIDPDIILTSNGDRILFPYLFHRSKINNIANQLKLNINREQDQNFIQNYSEFTTTSSSPPSYSSFMSYGRVYFRPRQVYLYGRIHIDIKTSFIYKETGLDGLSEVSGICRIPLQIASRATIGKCLSSLYFYNAKK